MSGPRPAEDDDERLLLGGPPLRAGGGLHQELSVLGQHRGQTAEGARGLVQWPRLPAVLAAGGAGAGPRPLLEAGPGPVAPQQQSGDQSGGHVVITAEVTRYKMCQLEPVSILCVDCVYTLISCYCYVAAVRRCGQGRGHYAGCSPHYLPSAQHIFASHDSRRLEATEKYYISTQK